MAGQRYLVIQHPAGAAARGSGAPPGIRVRRPTAALARSRVGPLCRVERRVRNRVLLHAAFESLPVARVAVAGTVRVLAWRHADMRRVRLTRLAFRGFRGILPLLRQLALSGLVAVVVRLAQLTFGGVGVCAPAILMQGTHGTGLVVMGRPVCNKATDHLA